MTFQSQRRFFGGSNSIMSSYNWASVSFQSQRRFFGGSNTKIDGLLTHRLRRVSIAEAILWGEQPPLAATTAPVRPVSIAEAILWGEQRRQCAAFLLPVCRFNRRGDSLGGATVSEYRLRRYLQVGFQSQRRFFGGSNTF